MRLHSGQNCVECDDILNLAAVDSALANCSACYDEAMQEGPFCPRRIAPHLRQRVDVDRWTPMGATLWLLQGLLRIKADVPATAL